MSFSKEEILKKISEVPFWGHSIPLGHGIVTPGKVMHNFRTFERLALPASLAGKRVLDIGAWDGYYSFECEKRGADEVVAIDNLNRMQRPDEKQYASLGSKGFQIAKEILGSKVKYYDMDVYDLSPEKLGQFDIVLFLGVLYHLKYPVMAFEKISAVCKGSMYIETAYLKTFSNRPLIQYVEGGTLNNDPTNWCLPNISSVAAMARDAGFKKTDVLYHSPLSVRAIVKGLLGMSDPFYGRLMTKSYK